MEGLLLLALVVVNPHRINRESRAIRLAGLTLAAIISLANAWSVARAKMAMTMQAAISIVTVALVVARAVNILR